MKNEVFWGLVALWEQVWNQGRKKERLPTVSSPILKVILAYFQYFCKRILRCIFMRSHFLHFRRLWSLKVSKREVLGATFDAILGAGPKGENRCFM